jgi:hypothetical protein
VAFQIPHLLESKGWSQKDLPKNNWVQPAISAIEQVAYKRHSLPLPRRIAQVLKAAGETTKKVEM